MSEFNPTKTQTTNLNGSSLDYSVTQTRIDYANNKENEYYFSDAPTNFSYYKTIPELKAAINALAIYTVGLGYESNTRDQVTLERIKGWGEDTFTSILWNMVVTKKICGDAFAEIIRNDNGTLINLKPISPERIKIVYNNKGIILRYEQIDLETKQTKHIFKPYEMLHLSNDRIADQCHGESVMVGLKWVITALHEALSDQRILKHRDLALGVLYIASDSTTKQNSIITQYQNAIKNGEVLVLPDDVARIEKPGELNTQDRLAWINFLTDYFYRVVGIPKVIMDASTNTEASAKISFLSWQVFHAWEQKQLEMDLWNQLAIKVTFNKPPSLMDNVQRGEAKNTGQTGFQPQDATAGMAQE